MRSSILAHKFLRTIGLCLILGVFSSPSMADETLATIDGANINTSQLNLAMQDIGRTLPRRMTAAQRNAYVLNYLIDLELAAKHAVKLKLDDSPEFKKKMEYFRKKALMEAFIDNLGKAASSQEKIKAAYDKAAKDYKAEPEVKASHILVPTEAEAKAALKRVQGGEDFAKVAKEVSKDPGSPGGSLGWFTKKRMVPPFAKAAFKTPVGTLSKPVKSRFGWHIIKVEGRRTKEFPKLEQVRDQIKNFLVRKAQTSEIQTLRRAAKIERASPKK